MVCCTSDDLFDYNCSKVQQRRTYSTKLWLRGHEERNEDRWDKQGHAKQNFAEFKWNRPSDIPCHVCVVSALRNCNCIFPIDGSMPRARLRNDGNRLILKGKGTVYVLCIIRQWGKYACQRQIWRECMFILIYNDWVQAFITIPIKAGTETRQVGRMTLKNGKLITSSVPLHEKWNNMHWIARETIGTVKNQCETELIWYLLRFRC